MKPSNTDFDKETYQVVNIAREGFLRNCISQIPFRSELATALDLGCGAGYFSGIMYELGFEVTGLDLRKENIEVCQARYPDINFGLINLDKDFGDIGSYDVVLMFGILYHLESPLQTILRLKKTIDRIGIVSTRVAAGEELAMYLFEEKVGVAHNIARTTVVPTFPGIVNIFRDAGFDFIYLPQEQPNNIQWSPRFGNGRRYSFLVCREPVNVVGWKRVNAKPNLKKWAPIDQSEKSFVGRGLETIMRKFGF